MEFNKITRREAIIDILVLTTSGKIFYDFFNNLSKNNIERKIYNELPKHIHIAKTDFKGFKGISSGRGAGFIINQQYITPAHCVGNLDDFDYDLVGLETKLYGKKLKKSFISQEDDIAIFDLPKNLNLENFPSDISNKIELGDRVYIIGNPHLTGTNVRKANVSDLDTFSKKHINKCFGIDKKLIPGDSGTPIVNEDYKLIGMSTMDLDGLGYAKRIGEYIK